MKKEYNVAIIGGVFVIIAAIIAASPDFIGEPRNGYVIFVYDTPSLTSVDGIEGPDECSDRSKWCYDFTKIEMMETDQDSQTNLRINLQIKDDFGSEKKGQIYVSMTVITPNSKNLYDPKLIDITKGEPGKAPFDVSLSTKGHYSLLFELISTEKNDNPHVFHTYAIDFDFP